MFTKRVWITLGVAEYKTVGSGLILRLRLEALINEYYEPVSIKKNVVIKIVGEFAILSSSRRRKKCEFAQKYGVCCRMSDNSAEKLMLQILLPAYCV